MYTDSEGIILKQIRIAQGRRMVVLLTDKYGKISAGTSIPEKGRNKSSLALRPFTRGRYELYKNRDNFSINGAEVLSSYYSIGENVDKYFAASMVLELTDKMLQENETLAGTYRLLSDFLSVLSERKSEFDTLVIAYEIKSLVIQGIALSQNPLMLEQSNDKIDAVRYIESHSLPSIKDLSIEEKNRQWFIDFIKKYIADNLGIEGLRSEALKI